MPVNRSSKLGLWLDRRVNTLWSWLISLMIIMFSIRGIIVLNSELSANTVYITTAIISLMLATYGFMIRGRDNNELRLLKNLLFLNGILTIFNVAVDLMLGVPFNLSILYYCLGAYVVFLFLRVPTFYLKVAIYLIAIAISYSVCDNFFDTLQGNEGVEKVFEYNSKLRPEVFEFISRTGEFFRVGGYTGNYHDSANILGMVASFFAIRFLMKNKIYDLVIFLVSVFSLSLTQSATNIIVAISTIFFFSGYILLRSKMLKTYIYMFLGVASIIALGAAYGDVMSIFLARIGEEGDWEGMQATLDVGSVLSAIPSALVGHADGFGYEIFKTEIGFIKVIFQFGIVHAIILFWILIFPIVCFVKIRSICSDALPSVAAVFFGFMSLLHYGSLFRVTNIFLFFAFYAICLNNIIYCRNTMRLSE